VFQQPVTFTVTVTPQFGCTPTGTVTLYDGATVIASNLQLTGGLATFTTSALSVAMHSITATYSGDANFITSNSTNLPVSQTVNKASTSLSFNLLSPSTVFVGQPVTISYTFGVVAPGAGLPIAPTGNITLTATDNANPVAHNSSCVALPTFGGGSCILSPSPAAAGSYAYTINYSGDGNFVASGDNGNYNVYQLAFTTQPSNTGTGLPVTPAVVVTAEDSSNNPFTSFTGGITLALLPAAPGTLSGTLTQHAVAGAATFNDLSINKIANGYTLTASPSGGVPDATSTAFNIDTFYVDNQGNFGTLDLVAGTATQIGAATVPNSTGIDLTPTPQVYVYNTSGQLVKIDPSTGSPTSVGSPGSIPNQATTGALADGSYFGIDSVTGNLYSINLTTGVTTQVNPTTTPTLPPNCALESSLSGSASMLYYTVGFITPAATQGNPNPPPCSAPTTDSLYQVDPASGTTTPIGPITIAGSSSNGFVGSAFVGGTLYGFTSGGQEYTIDPTTGVATFLTNTTAPILAAGSQ
jgi:hypothetical protein